MTSPTADRYAADIDPATRHRSSYTANNGNCVELAQIPALPDIIAVQDTWYPERPDLRGTKESLRLLTEAALTGRLTNA
ncbi:DUF397 domain-containing protein [Streptomyces sp. NPDC001787]|uniref:DUF397 domain-containing protein n=1 Tax=Streptomyces sp. NPDC001787 TaxID=3154523 RepID=UPI00331B2A04